MRPEPEGIMPPRSKILEYSYGRQFSNQMPIGYSKAADAACLCIHEQGLYNHNSILLHEYHALEFLPCNRRVVCIAEVWKYNRIAAGA